MGGMVLASIELRDVSIEFPVYNNNGRSLKKRLMQVATGGQIGADPQGRRVVRALHGVSFQARDGDRIGLVGHNGAGKSTLLRALNRVYWPSRGELLIQGTTGSLIDISIGIDPEATGRENIFVRGALLGVKKADIRRQIDEVVAFSELGEFIDMPVRTYSSGMHLRLAFAVSTMMQPQILLMDEWLSVGDGGFRQKAERRMAELLHSTHILVIASHSRQLVEDTCNRVIWLEHGGIRKIGAPEEILPEYFAVPASMPRGRSKTLAE